MSMVNEQIAVCLDKVIEYRRWFHQHPELSGQEKETAAYIANSLREMGLEPQENVGGYGVVALIEGKAPGKCVGLRADFDALPIEETTGLPFASENPGVMHACGHDMHAAMLLGAARVLNQMKDQFSGCVKLVFQPSEENNVASGAKAMIADGVLENPKVDAMIGQHMWPLSPTGTYLVRNGAMMASSDRFYITIHGKKSHGSAPENGVDAVVIASQVITALQTIVSRNVSPNDSAVITIGEVRGGIRYNVIPDKVEMIGTCRNFSPEMRNSMPERIEKIVKGVTECMGGSYDFEYLMCYSPTVNDPAMFQVVREAVEESMPGTLIVPEKAAMTGEDFSFFCEQVPSCYCWLGCQEEGKEFYPLHHGSFSPDERSIPIGIEAMVSAALKFLNE